MKSLHLNNSTKSQQSLESFGVLILNEIMGNNDGVFQISVDDGDGDVYKYTITVSHAATPTIKQITDN